jgi:hypothetical protein
MTDPVKIRASELQEDDFFLANNNTLYKVAFLDSDYINCHVWNARHNKSSDKYQLGRNSQKLVYKINSPIKEKVV